MKSAQERADLRLRRASRRLRRAANEQVLQESKERGKQGSDDEAALAYDRVRKQIRQTADPHLQSARWLRLADVLDDFFGSDSG
jgi:hypothetical protein